MRSPWARITSTYSLTYSLHTLRLVSLQELHTPRTEPTSYIVQPVYSSLDVLCGPLDGAGQCSALESSGMKVIKGDVCQVIVHFFELLKDDTTLLLDLRFLQCTVLHNVGQKLNHCNIFATLAVLLPHCYPALLKGEKTKQQGYSKRGNKLCWDGGSTQHILSHSIGEGQITQF